MNAIERSALILGDEPALVERFVPFLRRCNLSVQRLVQPSGPIQFAEEAPRDLVVIVPPIANAARLFARARAAGAPWRQTGVLLIAERSERATLDPALLRFANRMLSPSATTEEFQREVADLLEVAPRVAVEASVQLKLVRPEGEPKSVAVENLSSTGMFLLVDDPPPVGTVFGFALELPSEREPILGQAGVVRKASDPAAGRNGIGVRFLSLGGEGSDRIERLVQRQRERSARSPVGGAGSSATNASGTVARPARIELSQLKDELAELESLLTTHLWQGLARRLGSADWYLTGMELGLDSLHAFSALLDAVQVGSAAAFETQNRVADLALVRRKLTEFAAPQQELRKRVQIMLELRPPLERLRRRYCDSSTADPRPLAPARPPEVVLRAVAEIRRMLGNRKSLESLRALLNELGSARALFAPGAQRRALERITQEHRPVAAALGLTAPDALASRDARKRAQLAVERELGLLDGRLKTVHDKVYSARFRHLASANLESDLSESKSTSILAETLAPGREYLDRAFSVYRHALELAGAEPDLLERAATLAATIRSAEREQSSTRNAIPPVRSEQGA